MRLVGSTLILIGFIFSIIIDIFLIFFCSLYYIDLAVIIPWIPFIISLKLENELVLENIQGFFTFLVMYSAGLIAIGVVLCTIQSLIFPFIFLIISNVLLLFCWHFSISIYKIKKLAFLICGISYCVVSLIFRSFPLILEGGIFSGLVSLVFVSAGMVLIIIAETQMRKKGLLNYI